MLFSTHAQLIWGELEYGGQLAPVVLIANKKYAMTEECYENMWDQYFMPTSTASCDTELTADDSKTGKAKSKLHMHCDLADYFYGGDEFTEAAVKCVNRGGPTGEEKAFEKAAGEEMSLTDSLTELKFHAASNIRAWHNGANTANNKSIQTYYYGDNAVMPDPISDFHQGWHNRRR
jgi:hypothetical protein